MKTEMNMNELEHVNGGNFLDDIKNVLKKIKDLIPNPIEPKMPDFPDPFKPETPIVPDQPIARG